MNGDSNLASASRVVLRLRHAFAATVVAHPRTLLAVVFLATVGAATLVGQRLRVDSSSEVLFSSDYEVAQLLERMRTQFGRDDMFLLLIEGDVFSSSFLERLRRLHHDLESLQPEGIDGVFQDDPSAPGDAGDWGNEGWEAEEWGDEGWEDEDGGTLVEQVTSLVNVRKMRFEDDELVVGGLLDDPPTAVQLEDLKRTTLSDPNLVGHVVDERGRFALVSVRTVLMPDAESDAFAGHIARLASSYEGADFRISHAGYPVLNASINTTMQDDAAVLFAGALLIMTALLAWVFRSPWAVAGSLTVVLAAVVWTLTAMALADAPVTIVTNVLPAFLICIGIADSVHILNLYRKARS